VETYTLSSRVRVLGEIRWADGLWVPWLAVNRYKEANESLALSVRIHEQLLGQRHPQLLKPLLVAAENAAVWGSDLGMEGRPQVLHAMVSIRHRTYCF
jgi:hypothetical protein